MRQAHPHEKLNPTMLDLSDTLVLRVDRKEGVVRQIPFARIHTPARIHTAQRVREDIKNIPMAIPIPPTAKRRPRDDRGCYVIVNPEQPIDLTERIEK